MKLYLIRHGQTRMNTEHRMQGRTDTRLNDKGRAQAMRAGEFLAREKIVPDRIIVSPLDRAQETAELVTGISRQHFETDPRMIEMSFGAAEGQPVKELEKGFYENFFHKTASYEPPEGGETYDEVFHRVADFVEDLRSQYILRTPEGLAKRPAGSTDDDTVLVVSHGAALHTLLAYVGHTKREDLWSIDVNNCAILRLELSDRPAVYEIGSPYEDHYREVFEGFGGGAPKGDRD